MSISGARVLFLNWRDSRHPEGGGSERYVHQVAEGLAAAGAQVTLFCAAHDRAPADEVVRGVRIVRRGGRFGVYPRGLLHVVASRPDLVVDVQNGVPFGTPLVRRGPVLVLLHHVHREQWPVLFGRAVGAVGWFLESRVAPLLYRGRRYVTVSGATADELDELGVDRDRIAIVVNGVDPTPRLGVRRSSHPRLVVLGRLVPHKRVEHAIDAVAAWRDTWPGIALDVVGEGWWAPRLAAYAERAGVADRVHFHGFVDERRKHELLAGAWVHLCPSIKEGWGIVVTEAAGHGVPTVAYRSAGGLRDSVRDGVTGVLVDDDEQAFHAAVGRLLDDAVERARLGREARRDAARYSWEASAAAFTEVVAGELERVSGPAGAASAGAVLQDLDRSAVPDGVDGRCGERAAGDEHGAHPEHGSAGQGGDQPDERLHVFSRWSWRLRRRVTIEAPDATHNVAQTTPMPAIPWALTTAAMRSGEAPDDADDAGRRYRSSH